MRILPIITLLLACGGPQTGGAAEPGDTHEGMTTPGGATPDGGVAETPATDAGTGTTGPTGQEVKPEPPSPYRFELANAGESEVVFSVDKGWQPVIFAYTGKPPRAKAALLFPTACTESCDTPPESMCPVCRQEEDVRKRRQQEREETRREIARPGASVSVPWDGKLFVYEKAPKAAGRKKCKCWRKVDPEPGTYTVKACGLKPPTKVGAPSRPACAETQVELPLAAPATIKLSFK